MRNNVRDCLNYIRKITDFVPDIAVVLGSGLGGFTQQMDEVICSIPYNRIPGFPISTVSGHAGKFVMGNINGVPVICMEGRVHYYEGYTPEEIAPMFKDATGLENVYLPITFWKILKG